MMRKPVLLLCLLGVIAYSTHAQSNDTNVNNMLQELQESIASSSPLHNAAARGDSGKVERLIRGGADVNARTKTGNTPLHFAVGAGHVATTEVLLKHNAEIDARNNNGRTPFFTLVTSPAWKLSVAHAVSTWEIMKLLAAKGANLNARDKLGGTPLLSSVLQKSTEMVQTLLELGADPNMSDKDGFTPLVVAAAEGLLDITKSLLEHNAQINTAGSLGVTPLAAAKIGGHAELVKLLRERGAK